MGVGGVGHPQQGVGLSSGQQGGNGGPGPAFKRSAVEGGVQTTFDNLPAATIPCLFTHLSGADLARFSCVSREWKQVGKKEKQNRIKPFPKAINEDTRSIEDMMGELTAEQQKCLDALKSLPPNDIGQSIQTLRPEIINKQTGNTDINPILQDAAKTNKIDNALLALILGADIDTAYSMGITPLYRAAFNGHTEITKILLETGADINKADALGCSPLFVAACGSHTKTVKALLAAGADVNKATSQKTPALYRPALNGHKEIVQALLEAGAGKDVYKANLDEETPLSAADRNGHAEIVDMLEKAAQDAES